MLRPSDVLVLFALVAQHEPWTLRTLAERLGVQHSKVQRGLDRLAHAGLYDADRRRVIPAAAEEFVLHGLRYMDPLHPGPVQRGVPTAWGALPLSGEIVSPEDSVPVWPSPHGTVRGPSVEPLDPALIALVDTWPEVAQLAALADGLRLGDARTRRAAETHLRHRLAPG